MKKNIFCLSLFLAIPFNMAVPAFAGWGKLTVDSGAGDQVVVKHGLLGRKTIVEDRLGDGFATSHSIFGTKSAELSVLGNGVRYHKGLLGFSSANAHTMLGDSLSTHKNILYRNTNVNVSGINSLFGHYLHPGQASPPPYPPVAPAQNASPGLPRVDPAPFNQGQSGNSEP